MAFSHTADASTSVTPAEMAAAECNLAFAADGGIDALEHGTGGFTLHTGLPDYDTNHHGHRGASCAPPWSPYDDCKMIAHDLLDQNAR